MTSLLASSGSGLHATTFSKDSQRYMSSNHAPNGTVGAEKYHQSIVTPPSSSASSSVFKSQLPQQAAPGSTANPFPTPTSSAAGTVPSTSGADYEQHDMEMAQPLDPDVLMGNSGFGDVLGGKRRMDSGPEDYPSPSKRSRLGKEGQPVPSIEEALEEQKHVGPLYLVASRPIQKVYPDPTQNVIGLYGLQHIADSVARFDASGQKNKLRKSYKRYILDLPGKDDYPPKPAEGAAPDPTLPPPSMDLLDMLDWPDEEWHNQKIQGKEMARGFDPNVVRRAVTFGPGPLAGFDPAILGLDESDPTSHRSDRQKSHRIQTPGSAGMPTPHAHANGSARTPGSGGNTPGDSTNRSMRKKKRRRYDDQSFEGYDGFDDDEDTFSAQDDGPGGIKKKKRRKEHEAVTPMGHSHYSSMKSGIAIS